MPRRSGKKPAPTKLPEKKPNYGLKFTKFTKDKERQQRYLFALEQGATLGGAAKYAGISPLMAREYRKMNPDFDKVCLDARDSGLNKMSEDVEDALYRAAKRGNIVAMLAWLYNRLPHKWKDMRSFALKGLDDVLKLLPPEFAARLRPYLTAAVSA